MDIKFDKGKVIITIPADAAALKKGKPSKSGKSTVVATTSGFAAVEGAPNLKLSLNLIAKE